ncbi:hypothetical protein ACHAPJ_010495 [Fusarium lateritium]
MASNTHVHGSSASDDEALNKQLKELVEQPDPLFLGKIWRLGLVLRGLDRRAPQLHALSTVFERMRTDSYKIHGKDSPISVILDCIVDVDETDFTPTMRIGFQESLTVLDHKVSDENIMMLSLWITYHQYSSRTSVKVTKRKPVVTVQSQPPKSRAKAAKKKASEPPPEERLKDHMKKDILLLKFNKVRQDCFNAPSVPPQEQNLSNDCLLISHYYAYDAFWVCDEVWLGEQMAQDIINSTMFYVVAEPVWSNKAMAFSVACKRISTMHRKRGEIPRCESILMGAINALRSGDRTRRIRAMGMCLTLSSWRREWGDIPGSRGAEELLLEI